MTPGQYAIWASIALLGVLGSAVCSGMETGLYAMNRATLALRARHARDRMARLLEREASASDRALATLLIANNVFNYLGALGVTAILAAQGHAPAGLIALNALIITPILLVFAESLPKELYRRNAIGLLVVSAPVLTVLRIIFTLTGVLPLVLAIARAAGRGTGLPLEPEMGVRQRIAEMLKQDDRVLSIDQGELIDRAMVFAQATVANEMTPWSRVVTVSSGWDRERMVRFIADHPHRRYPVVNGSGEVLGTLDSMRLLLDPGRTIADLTDPVPKTRPNARVRESLELLRDSESRMVIVETKGKPLGLATPKDLVEPLTGELLAW